MKKQNVKTLAAVALVVGFATTLGGQRAPVRNGSVPDFDIRSLRPQGSAAVEQTLATATVERRIAALMSLQAAPDQMQLGTRIIPNQYGLPKVYRREGRSLSGRSTLKQEEIARGFLQSQSAVFSLSSADMDGLRLVVEDATDNAIFLTFNQVVKGIDVFNAQIKFMLNKDGEVIQVSAGDVAPGLNLSTTPVLSPGEAVRAAFAAIGSAAPALAPAPQANGKAAFRNPRGGDYTPITAELSIFPITASSARLAYQIFLEAGPESWYEILLDAGDGSLLFRHNLYTLVTFPDPSTINPSGWLPQNEIVTTGNVR